LSRKAYPKQFLKLFGNESLLQQTFRRLRDPLFGPITVLSNNDHRFLVAEQAEDISTKLEAIVLEPVGRNTAPAAAVAALMAARESEDGLCLLLPSDHDIPDRAAFVKTIASGLDRARAGAIVTFGVTPDSPHTGYGYIETEAAADLSEAVRPVVRFVEKPDRETAEAFMASGSFYWNAGIFLFSAKTLLAAFERFAPSILATAREALDKAQSDLDFLRLNATAYAQADNISIDYAIMEKAQPVDCVPLNAAWSDVGSWAAIWSLSDKDEYGNVRQGDGNIIMRDTRDSFVHSDGQLVSLVGLENVLVVATKDAVLVADRAHAEDVKAIAEHLNSSGRIEGTFHTRVYRPWGWFEGLSLGDRFQVKCIMVKPGAQLSLQSHYHRSEHWVVVKGTAQVTKGDQTMLLSENESTYIAIGEKHRLANPGKIPTFLIEVQSGAYLGEDDIERFEDVYGRQSVD
jgi:mannose-1-phosphate guanylyltransferase/mannose-6-phosphate isomerase